jgi:hypothetical protein
MPTTKHEVTTMRSRWIRDVWYVRHGRRRLATIRYIPARDEYHVDVRGTPCTVVRSFDDAMIFVGEHSRYRGIRACDRKPRANPIDGVH